MAENTLQSEQGARFERIIHRLDLTQVAVGELVGLSQSYISQMITGARPISKKILQFIAKRHPQVNLGWLISGDGQMINGASEVDLAKYQGGSPFEQMRQMMEGYDQRIMELETEMRLLKEKVERLEP